MQPQHHEPLTVGQQDRITELAEQGWGSTRIAREIGRHQSAVQWFLYRTGLRAPGYGNAREYVRSNGRVVKPWTPEQDRFIVEMRIEGRKPREIARLVTARFGHPRSHCTVANRLVMLAARDELAA